MGVKMNASGSVNKFKEDLNRDLFKWKGLFVKKRLDNAMQIIKQTSQEIVPYDTGATHNSWYSRTQTQKGEVVATFGYDENNQVEYLLEIYENVRGQVFKNQKQDRWLHKAIERNQNRLIATIRGD